jgi:hypothetical protein
VDQEGGEATVTDDARLPGNPMSAFDPKRTSGPATALLLANAKMKQPFSSKASKEQGYSIGGDE